MRQTIVFIAGAALAASPVYAADELKFGPVPAWVIEQSIPSKATSASEAPAAFLLNDTQIRLEPGRITQFTELAIKVQSPNGLAAGNIAFPWQPAHDTVTVNKLHIIRDGNVIDVLKSGQTFTVARRETNMEAAVLDGTLTANIQPEGLQVGDIINLAVTTERVDPVMKGHVESLYGVWDGATIEKAHVRISWPTGLKLITHHTDELPRPKRSTKDGWNVLELSAEDVEPLLLPKGAPMRFRIGRAGEATDFQAWSDLADLMAPMYRQAAVVPKSGPLRDELEKIRQAAKSEKERAEKALQLVEERVRYVALAMGTGGYVPAPAEVTWSRRFGDCKAKSALLIALLQELGMEAEPVAVHSRIGDAIPQRLPMISYFDHVIVRARVGGKTYWLDGTRTGDSDLDGIPVPKFHWGLPLVGNSRLVPIMPAPLVRPETEALVEIDASAGVFAPATFSVEQRFRGDDARALSILYSKMSSGQLEEAQRDYWRGRFDYVTVDTVSSSYDKQRGEMRLTMKGSAKLPWKDGWLYVPASEISYDPDFNRAPGRGREAPFALPFPQYETTRVTVRLPKGFGSDQDLPPTVKETLAGIEYLREVGLTNSVLTVETSERAIAPEISFNEALAAAPRLKVLDDDDVYLRLPEDYRMTDADTVALLAATPGSSEGFAQQGAILATTGKYNEAIAAFTEALRLDPQNANALSGRATTYRAAGDSEKALADSEAALKLGIPSAELRLFRANVYRDRGERDLVLNEAELLIQENPKSDYALVAAAKIFSAEGKRDRAMEAFDRALELSREAYIYINRAQVRSRDDVAGKLADLDQALKLEPDQADALRIKASLLLSEARYSEAVALYDRALQASDSDPLYLRRDRAVALYKGGRVEEAEKAFAQLRDEAKTSVDLNNLCWRKATAGVMLESALSDCREAVRLDPHRGNTLDSLGFVLLRLGRLDEAIVAYDKAIASRNDPVSLMGRAITYARKGDARRAQADRAEALKLNADVEARFAEYGLAFEETQKDLVSK